MTNEVAVLTQLAENRVIRSIEIVEVGSDSVHPWLRDTEDRQALVIVLESGWMIVLVDACGQSCCEHRYMSTDDDLNALVGESLVSIRHMALDTGDDESSYGVDVIEAEFVCIQTDRDSVVVGTYNSHNGYYGGLDLAVTVYDPAGHVVVNRVSLYQAE